LGLLTAIDLVYEDYKAFVWEAFVYETFVYEAFVYEAFVYKALISAQPYKKPFSCGEKAGLINDGRGKHFDPDLIDLFEQNLQEFKKFQQI
jgi:hypothetical protein